MSDTQERGLCEDGGREWRDAATSPEHPAPPGAGRGRKDHPLQPRRECGPMTPWFWTFGLQGCECINVWFVSYQVVVLCYRCPRTPIHQERVSSSWLSTLPNLQASQKKTRVCSSHVGMTTVNLTGMGGCVSPSWLLSILSLTTSQFPLLEVVSGWRPLWLTFYGTKHNTSEWMIRKAHDCTNEKNSNIYEIKICRTILFAQIKHRRICKEIHWRFKWWRVVIVNVPGGATQDVTRLPNPAKRQFQKPKYPWRDLTARNQKVLTQECGFLPPS